MKKKTIVADASSLIGLARIGKGSQGLELVTAPAKPRPAGGKHFGCKPRSQGKPLNWRN